GVVNREALPDLGAHLDSEGVGYRLPTVDVEVVNYQMDGFGLWVLHGQLAGHSRELESGTVGCGEGEMAAGFRLYGTDDIGCTAALVLVVAPCFASRLGGRGRTDV